MIGVLIMIQKQWIENVTLIQGELKNLIAEFHPASNLFCRNTTRKKYPITAPEAEVVCQHIRDKIQNQDQNPLILFEEASKEKDIENLFRILNAVWFGAPESVETRKVPGFMQMCNLLDDPPF